MSNPRNTDSNYRAPYGTPRSSNYTTWGIGAAIVVAIAIGWYAYSHNGNGPIVANDDAHPGIGMNAPAPTAPDKPATPAPVTPAPRT